MTASYELKAAILLAQTLSTPNMYRAIADRYGNVGAMLGRLRSDAAFLTEILGEKRLTRIERLCGQAYQLLLDEYAVKGIKFLHESDNSFPERLKYIDDAPFLLYYIGDVGLLDKKSIALAGTRRNTGYGKSVTETFTTAFCTAGAAIVCGLSDGIEAIAAKRAMENCGYVIGVVADGLGDCTKLAQSVCENGLLISETPLNCPYRGYGIKRSNRLISGIASCVLTVECDVNSGSLSICEHAVEQGRDIYAIPGEIFSRASKGTNALIKKYGSEIMVTDPSDILTELYTQYVSAETAAFDLSEDEEAVVAVLRDGEKTFTEIKQACTMAVPELTALLTLMEMTGYIEKLPGGGYMLNRSMIK